MENVDTETAKDDVNWPYLAYLNAFAAVRSECRATDRADLQDGDDERQVAALAIAAVDARVTCPSIKSKIVFSAALDALFGDGEQQ